MVKYPLGIIIVLSLQILWVCHSQPHIIELIQTSVIPMENDNEEFSEAFKNLLRKELKDVRVVALGENTHHDGMTFEYKAKLIKLLHEEFGFNVLATEWAFYGDWLWNKNVTPENLSDISGYSFHGDSEKGYPIYEYIGSTNSTDNPIYLAGFDAEKLSGGIEDMKDLIMDIKQITRTSHTKEETKLLDSFRLAVSGKLGNPYKEGLSFYSRKKAKQMVVNLLI